MSRHTHPRGVSLGVAGGGLDHSASWAANAAVARVAGEQGVSESGYRVLANVGANGNQEVPHLHIHLFGGAPLGPMIGKVGR